jgi:hypothetical protein
VIKRKQLFRHRPAEGMFGDCHRTAIACVLDLEPGQVPHYGELYFDDSKQFHAAFEDWLKKRGLRTVMMIFDCSLDDVLTSMGNTSPGAYYLLGGRSKTGVGHTVIGCGNTVAWDPHPDDIGLDGPLDGYYWINFIVPDFMYAKGATEAGVDQLEAEA